jgi:O-antigen/teichoic acid export membrane protein
MEKISSNKTIAKNTLFLYGRMLFNLVVSLYTSRVILQVLGVDDLGVYQVVAGIVAMFTFVNGSLAGATSRFLAFELGKNDSQRLARTFAATLNVHIVTAAIFFVVCETIGLWLVNYKLNIPIGREVAANVVYQASILMTMLSLVQSPYNAAIIAHERMKVFAYVGILDTLFKLIACYVLYITPYDRLMVYGAALLTFTVVINLIYYVYCRRSFAECRFRWSADWSISKPILVFSGWQLFGDFSLVTKNQGVNILLNLFYGVAINAACGFANTVYGAIVGFANNFMISIRPAITKSYSSGDYNRMNELIVLSTKFAYSFMLLLTVPFIFNCDYILKLWLKTPPEYTAVLCQYSIYILLVAICFSPIQYTINATGNNKLLSMIHGMALLIILPISYFLLRHGYSPTAPFALTLAEEIIVGNTFPLMLKKNLSKFDIIGFYKKAVAPCVITTVLSFMILGFLHGLLLFRSSFFEFLTECLVSVAVIMTAVYFIVMNNQERNMVKVKICNLKRTI